MRTVLLGLLLLIGSIFLSSDLYSQTTTQHVILHLKDFDSSKNLEVYSLFKNDAELEVVNSCDALGLIVIQSRSSSQMSRNEVRAYVSVRLEDLFLLSDYDFIEDLSKYEVLMDCRAEMQRQVDAQ